MNFKSIGSEIIAQIKRHYDEGVADGSQSVIHDWGHIKTVAENARWICAGEGGDAREQEIAYAAGLLHDYCREREDQLRKEGREDEHERLGAEFARKYLTGLGFDHVFVECVARAIATHSFGISGVADDRGEGKPDSLAAVALKVADKQQQALKTNVWRRAQFLGECSGGTCSDDEMLIYVRKRETKMRAYLERGEGKLLEKYFPDSRRNLEFLWEYNDELEREIGIAKLDPDADKLLQVIGALGIMRQGQVAGAKGIPVDRFVQEYAISLSKVDEKKLTGKMLEAYKFSKKMIEIFD